MKIECLSSIARSDLKVQMWLLLTATALAVAVVMPLFRSKAKLAGKHVIITGGSDGLGYCLAQEFIRKDCRVSIIARTQSKLDAAVARLEGLASTKPAQVHALPADVANNEQVGVLEVAVTCDERSKHQSSCPRRYRRQYLKQKQNLDLVIYLYPTLG